MSRLELAGKSRAEVKKLNDKSHLPNSTALPPGARPVASKNANENLEDGNGLVKGKHMRSLAV